MANPPHGFPKYLTNARLAYNSLCRIRAGWLAARTYNSNMMASTLALMDGSFRFRLMEYDKAHP